MTVFCAMRTSAPAVMVVLTVAVLLLVSGSAVPPTAAGATVALLVIVPPDALTWPTRVSAGIATLAGCGPPCVQVTTLPATEQFHPVPADETNARAGGRLSVTTMSPDAFGPALLATSV